MAWRFKSKIRHRKTPRREHRQNILWPQPYKCFLRLVSQGNRNKNKNKPMGSNETSFCTAKETIKKKPKRQPIEWEKIVSNNAIDKGLISKIYKQLIYNSTVKKTKNPIENGQKTWIGLFPKKIYRWQQVMKKMLNITNY